MLLVTGASGLLGASTVLQAKASGQPVAGLCHRHLLHVPDLPTYAVDLTDRRRTRDLIASLHPTQIIHSAAATNVDWCEEHPEEAEKINCDASSFLAELAEELHARMVYISTDSVFDGARGLYLETEPPAPLNAYARSKMQGEQAVLQKNPSALLVRVNLYGWNVQDKLSLAEWILEQLIAGKQVQGFTDIYFTPLLANDLADILLCMLEHGLSGLYHVVGSERVSKFEFAQRLAAVFGFEQKLVAPVRVVESGLRAARPPDISLRTDKICRALGRAMPDVEAGLRRFRSLRDAGYPKQLKSLLTGVSR
jgi:dTDP-4-dehydrorhamnose reductase